MKRICSVHTDQLSLATESIMTLTPIFRLTPPSQPNKVGLKCPSVRTSVRTQKVSSILMKFDV